MKRVSILMLALLPLTACTTQERSPDEIRRETAAATATAARDTKAVAKGVVEGLKQKGPMNINKASEEDLKTLPGIDDETARHIVENRPYDSGYDLVKKHVISKSEYDHVSDKIVTR
jgi:DNA uptake protein ComE-like DNA-binding protein